MIAAMDRLLKNLLRTASHPVPASILSALFNFLSCYFRFFVFPNVPIVRWGDWVGFFDGGSRIVLGELPFRDYFQFLPPGTDLVYAFLIRILGVQIWIPSLVMACLAAITALLMTLIASRVMRGLIIQLPGLLLAGFILLSSADATHHWFSTIAILAAIFIMMDKITLPRIAATGALCGLAACFTQTKGAMAVAGFFVFLMTYGKGSDSARADDRWRKCLLLCGTAAGVFAAVNVYFAWAAGFRQWIYCIIVYPLRYYPSPAINNWRVLLYDFGIHSGPAAWVSFPFVYATVPLVYIVFVVARRRWTENHQELVDKLSLLAIAGFAIFLAVAPSPSVKRLATVSPPAMILLAWFLQQPGKVVAGLRILLASGAIALATVIPARVQMHSPAYLNLPAGKAAFFDLDLCAEYGWILANTHPGEYSFGLPPLYSAFQMRNPAAIEGFHASDYTRPQQITALVESLDRHQVPMLVLRRSSEFLWATGSPADHLAPLRAYVSKNYRLTKTFATADEIWLRIEPPTSVATKFP